MTPARRTLTAGHDALHAHQDVTCKTCHSQRTFWAHVAPDPQGRAQTRCDRMAGEWLASHPCIATYAHPRRIARAA